MSSHCNSSPEPIMGPMDVSRPQVENAAFTGPLKRSPPSVWEKPTTSLSLLTKVRVPVTKVKMPTPVMSIDAVSCAMEAPKAKDSRLSVLPTAVITKSAFVKLSEPTAPLPVPEWVKVMGAAAAFPNNSAADNKVATIPENLVRKKCVVYMDSPPKKKACNSLSTWPRLSNGA